jgi:hypothetical protein
MHKSTKRALKSPSKKSQAQRSRDYLLTLCEPSDTPTEPNAVPGNLPVALPDHGSTDGGKGAAIRSGKKVKSKRGKKHKIKGDKLASAGAPTLPATAMMRF